MRASKAPVKKPADLPAKSSGTVKGEAAEPHL